MPTLRLSPTTMREGRITQWLRRVLGVCIAVAAVFEVVVVDDGALGTIAGAVMLVLVPSIMRGYHRAYWMTVGLLVLTAVLDAGDPDGRAIAMFVLALAVVLAASWLAFGIQGDPATRGWFWMGGPLTIAAAADLAERGGLTRHPLLLALLVGSLCLTLYGVRPWRSADEATEDERRRAADIVERSGSDTLAPFALRPDKRYFFSPDGAAFLAYRVVLGVALVSGDPLGERASFPRLLYAFTQFAQARGWHVAALGISSEALPLWRALGWRAHYTGDEAVLDPATFTLEGRAVRKVRQSVHRLERMGYRSEVVRSGDMDDALRAEVAQLAERRRPGARETGFSMAFASAAPVDDRCDCYTLGYDDAGRLRGFLHWARVPAGNAMSLSGMRRDDDVPNGFNEFLICATAQWARAHDVQCLSLNFAAFAAIIDADDASLDTVTALEQRALGLVARRFQLHRLLEFNRKFLPEWRPRYALYPGASALPRVTLAAMVAEAYVRVPWQRPARTPAER